MNLYYAFSQIIDRLFGEKGETSSTTKFVLTGIVAIISVMWFVQSMVNNAMQKQINQALLSNQPIDIKHLVNKEKAGARFICIVPAKHLIQDNKDMRDNLTTHQIKKLNRRLNPPWRMWSDDWHIVAIYEQGFRYYRISQTKPEYLGTKCLDTATHATVTLLPVSVGAWHFYVEALGRSGAAYLPNMQ